MLYESKKLMENGRQSEANKNMQMICNTLQCMARGGIHDHIGGGFHRYSVDECWHGEYLMIVVCGLLYISILVPLSYKMIPIFTMCMIQRIK